MFGSLPVQDTDQVLNGGVDDILLLSLLDDYISHLCFKIAVFSLELLQSRWSPKLYSIPATALSPRSYPQGLVLLWTTTSSWAIRLLCSGLVSSSCLFIILQVMQQWPMKSMNHPQRFMLHLTFLPRFPPWQAEAFSTLVHNIESFLSLPFPFNVGMLLLCPAKLNY